MMGNADEARFIATVAFVLLMLVIGSSFLFGSMITVIWFLSLLGVCIAAMWVIG